MKSVIITLILVISMYGQGGYTPPGGGGGGGSISPCSIVSGGISCPGFGGTAGGFSMYDTGGTLFTGWFAPATLGATTVYQLPTAPPSAGQYMVFGTPSSNISAGSWATPGGGGGASAGAYGSLPGTCSDGTTYQTNDSAFPTPALCHPANTWSWFFGGKSIIPAGALTMATQYSNGGTIDSTHGYDSILLPASGSNSVTARSYTPASMATPYTKYFQVNLPYFGDNNNYKLWVIGVIDATGVFGGVQCGVGSGANSGFWCRNVLLSSSGGYTGSPSGLITFTGTTLFPAAFSGPFVVGINDDGTVIHFTFGPSVQVQMELTAAALTKSGNIGSPTKIAYGGTNSGAGAAFTIQFVGAY